VPELKNEDNRPNKKFIIKMQLIKLQDIEEYIIKLFDSEAPPNLYFHNSSLVKNISNQVELLSNAERLPDEEYIDLRLASVFLLTGFITDYDKPMEASCRLVDEILPKYGFDQKNIESTKNLIINSFCGRLESKSDNILHDARFDYLGRVDYIRLTEKLLRERTEYGKVPDNKLWVDIQSKFLADNEFITSTANLLRSVSAKDQIFNLQESVKEVK
jgi:uncharacterized protein